jgi:hypothetical protein
MAGPRLQKTAREVLAQECIGRILRVFPSQWLDQPLAEILEAAQTGNKSAQTAWKLLNDSRFKKS